MHRLRCITCGKEYRPEAGRYLCDDCDSIHGTLEVIYPLDEMTVKKKFDSRKGIFQFGDLIPAKSHTVMDDYVGGTPLCRFVDKFGYKDISIKYDGTGISASYKDRASIIAINRAIEEGNDCIFCASTGNAASSLALLSANTNLRTVIFVPSTIPKGKLAQLMVAGAEIFPVEASYDEVFDLSIEIGLSNAWYTRNSAVNPYLLEGKKTGAYEICIQYDYDPPDYVFVGVGDGTIISSLCKGFKEFYSLGLIKKIPKIIGVQAQGASTLMKVFEGGKLIKESVSTIADSISVGNPRDVIKACKYLNDNGGRIISVSDDEIISAISLMAAETGIFSEPAGAVTLSALLKSDLPRKAKVCLLVTGNGLKDTSNIKVKSFRTFTIDEVYSYFGKE